MSWLRDLTQDTLRSRRRATVTCLILTILPFTNWLGLTLLGLVTLKQGAREGLFLAFLLAVAMIGVTTYQDNMLLMLYALVAIGLMWLAAVTLSMTSSWASVLQAMSIALAIAILLIHLVVGDLGLWWLSRLLPVLQQMTGTDGQTMLEMKQQFSVWIRFATGLQGCWLMLGAMWKLMFARALQAMLFNRRVIKQELSVMRIPMQLLCLATLCAAVVVLDNQAIITAPAALDMLPVLLLPMALVGISLLYSLLIHKNVLLWLVLAILGVLYFVQVCAGLIIIAVLDRWFNFRNKWQIGAM